MQKTSLIHSALSLFSFSAMAKKAQVVNSILGVIVALVVGTIGVSIVQNIISNTTFTGLTGTVMAYVTVAFALLLIVIAFSAIGGRRD